MILKKEGLVYHTLRWYGYEEDVLTEGISLCKIGWSVILGVPLIALSRALAKPIEWTIISPGLFDQDPQFITFHQYWTTVWRTALWPLIASLPLLILGFNSWYKIFPTLLMFIWLIFFVLVLGVFITSSHISVWNDNNDLIKVIFALIKSAKEKVCPIVKFS